MRKLLVDWTRMPVWMYGSYKEFQQGKSWSNNETLYATDISWHFLKLCKTIFNSILATKLVLLHSKGQSLARSIRKRTKTHSIRNVHGISNYFLSECVLCVLDLYMIAGSELGLWWYIVLLVHTCWGGNVPSQTHRRTTNVIISEIS